MRGWRSFLKRGNGTRTVCLAVALALLSAVGWTVLPARHDMDLGFCGADLAGGTQALVRLRIALALNPPMQLLAPWLLMALAMAPPLVAASLRHLAVTAADQSRYSILTFFAGYAVVWVLAAPIFLIL